MKNAEVNFLELNSNAEGFWRDLLRGFITPLKLPAIANPTSSAPSRGTQEIRFRSDKAADLVVFAKKYELTLYTVIQGAWSLLLSHYTGETDILFGATRVCDRQSRGEGLVPLRVSVHPDASVLSWLRDLQVKWAVLGDYASIPLAEIRKWSEVPPELPLFDTVLIWENDRHDWFGQDDYTLILSVDTESELLLKIEYDRSQFGDDAIARMLGHLENLLLGIITNSEQCLAQIPLLTERERHQLLVEWNQTAADYPKDKCIHQLFEEQVRKTPDAVALVFEQQQITYWELNDRANKLAQYLQTLGVEPEVLVGICTERSIEMIVGILGILKAGGAYVPLDLAYPKDRLAFMLSDSQVSVLLTQQHLVEKLPDHQARIVCLDGDEDAIAIAKISTNQIASGVKPTNLAYIIYTSGSTGKPKGVLISHYNVVRLFAATQSWFQFNQGDVWSLFHSDAFDFSVWEIWGALFYGGRLVIVPYYVSRSPELFYNLLELEKITVLNQTPSAFGQLIQVEESLNIHQNLSLRLVIFGGEALDIQSLRPWFERHGETVPQLVNMYGITETTVHVTYRPLSIADLSGSVNAIGRAIADLQLYLLNSQLQPVPIGIPGELYVGGSGLARGYLNRSELTSERFIAHLFSDRSEDRLYKTGDLGRYLPNGDIEYLGRIDNQVKIRGFRIELGEIESLLNQHPAIRGTKVIPREDIPGDKRLVAYLVLCASQTLDWGMGKESSIPEQLRQYLQQKLPDYMVPSAFVVLESFPLTTNGKIDHRSLPVPDLSHFQRESYVAPRTPTEKILANLWGQVLKVDPIGIHDRFFELGGHSLLGTQVVSRICKAFEIDLSIRYLFESPTIAELSDRIEAILWAKSAEISSTATDLEVGEL